MISNFIDGYEFKYDFYFALAQRASLRCEEALEQNGIRAITTFRAKRPDRLKVKLQQRQQQRREEGRKVYANDHDIRSDIVDLAGVRIALYFPDDRVKVEEIIREAFIVKNKKQMEGGKATLNRFVQRFDGYVADHYWVYLKEHPSTEQRYTGQLIEIQVASLLMHAWSEVNHDLGYKPIHGHASQDELRILDGINGLVLTGELFLQQLQAASKSRISSADRKFSNQYELGAFMQNHISKNTSETPLMGRLDILFEVLKALDLDSPRHLDTKLEGWDNRRASESSVALSVMDHIFSSPVAGDFSENYPSKRQILLNAVTVYGGLSGRSVRDLSSSRREMARFYQLITLLDRKDSAEDHKSHSQIDELWQWFEESVYIEARVAIGIASLRVQQIIDRLKLHLEAGDQRSNGEEKDGEERKEKEKEEKEGKEKEKEKDG